MARLRDPQGGCPWDVEQDFASIAPYTLEEAYEGAKQVATTNSIAVGEARGPTDQDGESVVALPVTVETSAFGTIEGELAVPVADGGIDWQPHLVFPGLGEGEELDRKTQLPKRAPLLAADRSVLAGGPADARTTNGAGGRSRAMQTRNSLAAAPCAESSDASAGTTTAATPRLEANRPTYCGPAPPYAYRAKRRGSWPRCTVIRRTRSPICSQATASTPSAARSTLIPNGSAICWRSAVRAPAGRTPPGTGAVLTCPT